MHVHNCSNITLCIQSQWHSDVQRAANTPPPPDPYQENENSSIGRQNDFYKLEWVRMPDRMSHRMPSGLWTDQYFRHQLVALTFAAAPSGQHRHAGSWTCSQEANEQFADTKVSWTHGLKWQWVELRMGWSWIDNGCNQVALSGSHPSRFQSSCWGPIPEIWLSTPRKLRRLVAVAPARKNGR